MSHDYPANALSQGYTIKNYKIIDILGVGGFGITYLAKDIQLKTKVAIKEYLPSNLAVRGNTLQNSNESNHSELQPKSQADKETYLWGLERFLNEARAVASLKHPNIVQIKHFFEANNTAYFVMDYEEGEALNKLLKKGERVEEDEIYKLTLPLLDGLKKVHSKHYLHRDISPSNIYIQNEGDNPILIDFGAARQSLVGKSHSMSSIIKVGYAPYEQYQTRGNQGPWSDIYAFGAVLYQLITGSVPIESTERINAMVNNLPDPLTPAIEAGKGKYSKKLLRAIDWALNVREKDRPQSVDQWVEALQGASIKTMTAEAAPVKTQFPVKQSKKGLYIFSALAISCLIIIGIWLYYGGESNATTSMSKEPIVTTPNKTEKDKKLTLETKPEEIKSKQVTPNQTNDNSFSIMDKLEEIEEPTTLEEPKIVERCEYESAKKCYDLGFSYSTGNGVKINEGKAFAYYAKACAGDVSKACLFAGSMYADGIGTKKNLKIASRYFLKGCRLGDSGACYVLGTNYDQGIGVKKNLNLATKYYSKGCKLNEATSCYMIGMSFYRGIGGVQMDKEKGKKYLNKACDLGEPEACLKSL